jgi:hypothetical protein
VPWLDWRQQAGVELTGINNASFIKKVAGKMLKRIFPATFTVKVMDLQGRIQ